MTIMRRLLVPLLLTFWPPTAGAQVGVTGDWERVRWEGSSRRGTYLLLAPERPARGIVMLLGVPDGVALPALLRERGVATVRPELRPWTLFLHRRTIEDLVAVLHDAAGRLGVPPEAVVAGGISFGGTGAVALTQHCIMRECGGVGPRAVFAVDAPLDMERLFRATNAVLQRAAPESNLEEARTILRRLSEELGGPPSVSPAAYVARSPFSYFAPRGGNARWLAQTPVRLYIEPDIRYWVYERRYDYYTINAFDAAAMINQLLLLDNEDAELVVTAGRGLRSNGERNPHSWSIVDDGELADWVVRQMP